MRVLLNSAALVDLVVQSINLLRMGSKLFSRDGYRGLLSDSMSDKQPKSPSTESTQPPERFNWRRCRSKKMPAGVSIRQTNPGGRNRQQLKATSQLGFEG
jgi:hypothetical protein